MDVSDARAGWGALSFDRGERLRRDFERDGYVLLEECLPAFVAEAWRQQALEVMKYARNISRASGGSTLVYRVVTGDAIRIHWPELYAFYRNEDTVAWIREVTSRPGVCPSEHIVSGVNLNILDAKEAVYRWHFDAVPYTLLIYLTEVAPEDGGALEFVPGCRRHEVPDLSVVKIVRHLPKPGTMVLMDGTVCYHRVAPLLRPALRLSIPLVYSDGQAQLRPTGLDSYLYEEAV